jgi:hypothetical protein
MASTAQLNSVELTEHTDTSINRDDSADAPTEGVSLAYPEGGREAWTCLLGSALIMFPSFGFQASSKCSGSNQKR